jgi:hypothetical protein
VAVAKAMAYGDSKKNGIKNKTKRSKKTETEKVTITRSMIRAAGRTG